VEVNINRFNALMLNSIEKKELGDEMISLLIEYVKECILIEKKILEKNNFFMDELFIEKCQMVAYQNIIHMFEKNSQTLLIEHNPSSIIIWIVKSVVNNIMKQVNN
jgi:hypothetical protein